MNNKIKQGFIDLLDEPVWLKLLIAFIALFAIPVLGTITVKILSALAEIR